MLFKVGIIMGRHYFIMSLGVAIVLIALCAAELQASQDTDPRRFVLQPFHLPEIRPGEHCIPGRNYKMACNTCRCGTNNVLLCTKMRCYSKWQTYSLREREASSVDCSPGNIILVNTDDGCQKCTCNTEAKFECVATNCTLNDANNNEKVENMLESLVNDLTLPVLHHTGAKCQPGNKYRVDCNACLCKEDGNLLCTKKYCLQVGFYNKQLALKEDGKSCAPGLKSEHDCVKCVCVNGTLKCEAIPDCDHNTLHGALRSNGLHIKTTLDIKKKEVCLDGNIYKSDCNKCFCHKGVLRCTVKKCLNYQESVQLREDLKKLERTQ